MSDVVICDSAVGALGVMDGLVFVHRVRVAGDDVPGVDEAGDVAEAAEGDIDEGVGAAEAYFDPYCWSGMLATWWSRQRNRERTCDRWEEDGDKSEEDVTAGHRGCIVGM
jgi:hypothetical protein